MTTKKELIDQLKNFHDDDKIGIELFSKDHYPRTARITTIKPDTGASPFRILIESKLN
jgi:hypothetical protein